MSGPGGSWRAGAAWVCLGLLMACPRVVVPAVTAPPPVLRGAGESCLEPGQCTTGFCEDGLCCERTCAAYETCALDGLRGTCVVRPLGAPCRADDQCPTGHCSPEGVCCNVECAQPCQSCTLPTLRGQCETARDNTDPGERCGGPCDVCFGGSCAPAVVGTNPSISPEGSLACEPGQACSAAGLCALGNGEQCAAPSECASGDCLATLCLSQALEPVDPPGLRPLSYRLIQGVGLRGDGAPCVLVQERAYALLPSPTAGGAAFALEGEQVALSCREPTGWGLAPWFINTGNTGSESGLESRLWPRFTLLTVPSGLLVVAFANPLAGAPGQVDLPPLNGGATRGCRVGAQWFHPGGVVGALRCLVPGSVLDQRTHWMAAVMDPENPSNLHLFIRVDDGTVLGVACPGMQCGPPKVWATGSSNFPGVGLFLNGRPALVDLDSVLANQRVVLESGVTSSFPVGAGCSFGAPSPVPFDQWQEALWPSMGAIHTNGRLYLSLQCSEGLALREARLAEDGTWQPRAPVQILASVFLGSFGNVLRPVQAPQPIMLLGRDQSLRIRVLGDPATESSLNLDNLTQDLNIYQGGSRRSLSMALLMNPALPAVVLERADDSVFASTDPDTGLLRFVTRPQRSIWLLRTSPVWNSGADGFSSSATERPTP